MPTSPLPSSMNSAGLTWPGKYKLVAAEGDQADRITCKSKQDSFGKSRGTDIDETENGHTRLKMSPEKLTVIIEDEQKDSGSLARIHNTSLEERTYLISEQSNQNSCNKVYCETVDENKSNEAVEIQARVEAIKCMNCECERRNGQFGTKPVRFSDSAEMDPEEIRVKSKKKSKCKWYCIMTLCLLLLAGFSSLVTYVIMHNLQTETDRNTGSESLKNNSESMMTLHPFLKERDVMFRKGKDGILYPIFSPESKRHSEKLSGTYKVLDLSSLKPKNVLLTWKSSLKPQYSMIEQTVKYSNGIFEITKASWYILHSKLNLVTYSYYDKNDNFAMKLYSFEHCVVMEMDEKNSVCDQCTQWRGWRGPSQIWKIVYLTKGAKLKVTMNKKDIVSKDSESNSFSLTELKQN